MLALLAGIISLLESAYYLVGCGVQDAQLEICVVLALVKVSSRDEVARSRLLVPDICCACVSACIPPRSFERRCCKGV